MISTIRKSLLHYNQPLTLQELEAFWLRKNKGAIIKCVEPMLKELAGKEFRLLLLHRIFGPPDQHRL